MKESTRPSLQFRAGPPGKQRRVTVLFRLILLIPHLAIALVYYAVAFGTFFGWFAAVFTGRNPFQRFTIGFLVWYGRVNSYLLFLTDAYPPLTLSSDGPYPVNVELATGKLRRTTVGFRLILMIPVVVVVEILGIGLWIASVIAWLLTLILGRLPVTMHKAFEASLRFNLRFLAYSLLAQEPYPRHLFGDPVAFANDALELDAAPASLSLDEIESVYELGDVGENSELATALGDPSLEYAPSAVESVDALAPGFRATTADHGADAASEERGDSAWTLVVAKSSKVLICVLMVVGLAGFVAYFASVRSPFQNDAAEVAWSSFYSNDISAITQAVSVAQPDFDSSTPNWHAIAVDCSNINATLVSLGGVAQYPVRSQDLLLLSGVEQVSSGVRACLDTVVPKFDAADESAMAKDFSSGNKELNTFLDGIPLRAFTT
jgi:Domain of unknown function (DUF4389)